jgi:hypothetical protein
LKLIIAVISVVFLSLVSVYSVGTTQDKNIVTENEEKDTQVEKDDIKNELLPLPDDKAIVINPMPFPKDPPPSPEPLPHSKIDDGKSDRIVEGK